MNKLCSEVTLTDVFSATSVYIAGSVELVIYIKLYNVYSCWFC